MARHEHQRGSSLMGILMVVTILGFLAVLVTTSLDSLGTGSVDGTGTPGISGLVGPLEDPTGGATAGPSGRVATGPRSAATAAACRADYASVQQATALSLASGRPPAASVAELVTNGFLSTAPSNRGYTVELGPADGSPLPQVLVDGRPGIEACDGPPAGP